MAAPNQRVTWQDFSIFLGRLRRRRGLSQQRFADAIGCNRITVWKLEKGRCAPSQLFLHNLARLGILNEQEEVQLAAFEQLRELHLVACDVTPGPSQIEPHHRQ